MKLLFENWRKYVKENEESFVEGPEETGESEGSGYPSKIARLILSGEDHGAQARELVLTLPSVNIGEVLDAFMHEVMKKTKPLVTAMLAHWEAERLWGSFHPDRLGGLPVADPEDLGEVVFNIQVDLVDFQELANDGMADFLWPRYVSDRRQSASHRAGLSTYEIVAKRLGELGISSRGWFLHPTDLSEAVIKQLKGGAYNFEPSSWAEIRELSEKRQLYERLWEKSLEKSEEESPDETSI